MSIALYMFDADNRNAALRGLRRRDLVESGDISERMQRILACHPINLIVDMDRFEVLLTDLRYPTVPTRPTGICQQASSVLKVIIKRHFYL